MPCFKPITGWRSAKQNENGKYPIIFKAKDACIDLPVTLPCGRCIGCKLEKSKQWAIRCVHEAKQNENNIFITLTYNSKRLPQTGSLQLKDFQQFMKRLRQHKKRNPDKYLTEREKIKFFHCGEYGEDLGRPHYHAILFNVDFKDKKFYKETNGNKLYTSETLEDLWGHGYAIIGAVTFESAAYVARYVTKKITGEDSELHYKGKKPEYITMSRNPGLGAQWYKKWNQEVYPDDFIVIRGKKMKVPKYYDIKKEEEDKPGFDLVKQKRNLRADKFVDDNSYERLLVREKVALGNLKQLTRNYETEL